MYICHYRFLTGSGGIELPVAALIRKTWTTRWL
nr:MAG TPA: hypothetical protein [Caudoviricetes sp.]